MEVRLARCIQEGLTLDAGAKLSLSKNVKISGGSLGAAELTVADNNYISGGATIDGLTKDSTPN